MSTNYCPECHEPMLPEATKCSCGYRVTKPKPIAPRDECDKCGDEDVYFRAGHIERDANGRRHAVDTIRFCYDHTHPIWRDWEHNYIDRLAAGDHPDTARAYADDMHAKKMLTICKTRKQTAPATTREPRPVGEVTDDLPL